MVSSNTEAPSRRFHRSLFGYRRSDVDARIEQQEQALSAVREELEKVRSSSEELGGHLVGLLTRFAESVTAGEHEAEERCAQIIADAQVRAHDLDAEAQQLLVETRGLAASLFADASARYDVIISARHDASERIEGAITQLAAALASLKAIPAFPDVAPPIARAGGGAVSFDLRTEASEDANGHDAPRANSPGESSRSFGSA